MTTSRTTLLTIDLGQKTGYALFRNKDLVTHGVVSLAELPQQLAPHNFVFTPDVVVVERPVTGEFVRGQRDYEQAMSWLSLTYGTRLRVIRPADWKPRYRLVPVPRGKFRTRHTKDAYRIGLYALDQLLVGENQ